MSHYGGGTAVTTSHKGEREERPVKAPRPNSRRGLSHVYPDRKRCLKCQQFFGFLVVEGLYDSYECAGRPDPEDTPPDLWPREHYVPQSGGERRPKAVFLTERDAQSAAECCGKEAYQCSFCGIWHIGSRFSVTEEEAPPGGLSTPDRSGALGTGGGTEHAGP